MPPYQLRVSPGRGNGLFATRLIEKGERIVHERLVMNMARREMGRDDTKISVQELYETFLRLPAADRERFMQHCEVPLGVKNDMLTKHGRLVSDFDGRPVVGDGSAIEKVLAIWRANAFWFEEPDNDIYAPETAMLNHSCLPNAIHSAKKDDNNNITWFNVHTIRQISQGEEIFIPYADHERPIRYREGMCKRYGFKCRCKVCDLNTPAGRLSERMKEDYRELEREYDRILEVERIAKEDARTQEDRDGVRDLSIDAEIENEEKMLKIVVDTGSHLINIEAKHCKALCGMYCAKGTLGSLEKAEQYLKRGVKLMRTCYGRDGDLTIECQKALIELTEEIKERRPWPDLRQSFRCASWSWRPDRYLKVGL